MPDAPRPHRLRDFPITLLPSVMGLAGLAVVWTKFAHELELTQHPGAWLLHAVSAWFAFALLVYLAKLVRHPDAVRKEFRHPIRVNFFAAISICFLLLSIGYLETGRPEVARALWWIGAPLHMVFLLVIVRGWFRGAQQLTNINPAWFIPVVGPILVPVTGVRFAHPEVSWFFFATGLLYWIVLLTVLLHRVFFHDPLPPKLRPTLFILLAPPAVGFIAYMKLTGSLDPFARVLFHAGLFTALLLLAMVTRFVRVPFFVSWWGYTFPLDAFTLSLYLMHASSGLPVYRTAALAMTGVTTLVIAVVLVATVRAAVGGRICVPED